MSEKTLADEIASAISEQNDILRDHQLSNAEFIAALAEQTASALSEPSGTRANTAKNMLWAAPLVGKGLAIREEIVTLMQAALSSGEPPSLQTLPGAQQTEEPKPGIIPLYGLITPHGSFFSMLFGLGGGGLDQFRARLAAAVADDNVSHIVIDVDSPGGYADLVPEAAADIRAAREQKPVIAVANCQAASAAYWIAAQASEFVVTPSGYVGSIGVYMVHTDWSRADEMDGIKTTLVTAGKYKAERSPLQPLSNDAKKAMQAEVDEIYGMFLEDVALGRNTDAATVEANFGQGRCLSAERAVAAGMADRVGTLEEVIGGIIQSPVVPDDEEDDDPDEPEAAAPRSPASAEDRKAALEALI
jgi:signal peptide peptidase SppA